MRNHITPNSCASSNASTEALHGSTLSNGGHSLDGVNRDHSDDAGTSSDLAGQVVPVASDFEGFGSFS